MPLREHPEERKTSGRAGKNGSTEGNIAGTPGTIQPGPLQLTVATLL
jgi:hypothetical protein